MTGAQRRNRKSRHQLGYDPDPPRCGNCANYQPPSGQQRHQTPGKPLPANWLPYVPARCLFGDFPLQTPNGVCDSWRGSDGSLLEIP